MDPLSISASALTFVGACRTLIAGFRFAKELSSAPAEIAEVSEELSDLQHVLTAVGMVTVQRDDDVFEVLLSPLLVKVDHILEELCSICGACSKRLKHDAEYAEHLKIQLLARFKWTREKGRVGGLRERLKVLRLDFANQLAAISLYVNPASLLKHSTVGGESYFLGRLVAQSLMFSPTYSVGSILLN